MDSEMSFMQHKQEKMKFNFNETCSRFSQFLKERRSFGHHLDGFKREAKDLSGLSKKMENERLSLELFPIFSSSAAVNVESSSNNMINCSELPKSKEEHKSATPPPSMTIFYGGKVLVFNELPEDKAREIMSLASRGSIMSSQTQPQNQIQTRTQTQNQVEARHLTQDVVLPQGATSLSDLPIARRVSLHRFMEKRKHRIATSSPYQVQNSSMPMHDYHSQKLNMVTNLYEKQQLELKL